jgi:hypothetical protein
MGGRVSLKDDLLDYGLTLVFDGTGCPGLAQTKVTDYA